MFLWFLQVTPVHRTAEQSGEIQQGLHKQLQQSKRVLWICTGLARHACFLIGEGRKRYGQTDKQGTFSSVGRKRDGRTDKHGGKWDSRTHTLEESCFII